MRSIKSLEGRSPVDSKGAMSQLWSVIEEVLQEDLSHLSQDSYTRKTSVKQKVFLERRTEEERGRYKAGHIKERLDLDHYLQHELDKHECGAGEGGQQGGQEENEQRGRGVKYRPLLPPEPPLSPPALEPKKVFRCTLATCSKTYVKSSHLKVTLHDSLYALQLGSLVVGNH